MKPDLVQLFNGLEHHAGRLGGRHARRVMQGLNYRAERLLRLSDALTPPRALRVQVGPFDDPTHYRDVGRSMARYFISCGLRPDHDLIDIGCGSGQLAAPLLDYLDGRARYEGFDISDDMIDWCRAHVTARRSSFRFQSLDLFNSYYRPQGRIKAAELVFPYADRSFDFAIAKSVFTHLLPADAENYVAQTARVLRPGGRAWFSFFLLDDGARSRIAAGQSTLDFRFRGDGYLTVQEKHPEYSVAYDEPAIVALLERHGFVPQPTGWGSWSGRRADGFQDSILALRR